MGQTLLGSMFQESVTEFGMVALLVLLAQIRIRWQGVF